MAQVIADRRDIDFVLYEQLKIDELTKFEIIIAVVSHRYAKSDLQVMKPLNVTVGYFLFGRRRSQPF